MTEAKETKQLVKASAQTAVVNYNSPALERLRGQLIFATAALIIFFPLPILFFFFNIRVQGFVSSLFFTLPILALLFFIVAVKLYKNNGQLRIIFDETGIGVPDNFYRGFSSEMSMHPWNEMSSISVGQDSSKHETLELSMDSLSLKLRLSCLSAEDLDKVVSACLLWSDPSCRDDSFSLLSERISGKRIDDGSGSFTGLWMQEASRRLRATPFTPLTPGTLLQSNRVKVVQAIGAGGWSAIYLCQWQDNTPAVLKEAVMPPAIEEELKDKAYEQFEREAKILAGLKHQQIAKVLDYFVENGRQYMVLERIPGPNLRTYVKDKGPVSEKQALKWVKAICEILNYLHKQDPPIVHRDLTPENLILDMRGSLVLIDFGSANEFIGTVTGTLVGKPSYVSPEQFSGHANLRSDLYSLGAVIHFMLTGEDPEPLTVSHPKQKNGEVSDELDKLVSALMELNQKKRIQNIDEVISAIADMEKPKPEAALSDPQN